jgi:hypothetical protein
VIMLMRFCCADPAAEEFKYPVSIDVRELISLEDAMEELDLGPNGCVKIFAVLSLMMLSGDTVTVWGV